MEVVACELFQQGLAETRVRFLAGLDTRCVLGPWSVRSADKSKHFKYRCLDNLFRVANLWKIRPICSNCNRGSLCIQLVPMGWSSHGRLKILFTSCLCWACTTRPAQWKHTMIVRIHIGLCYHSLLVPAVLVQRGTPWDCLINSMPKSWPWTCLLAIVGSLQTSLWFGRCLQSAQLTAS